MKVNTSGRFVTLKDGRKVMIYNELGLHKGKHLVYIIGDKFQKTGEKVLCSPESLTVAGYFD